MFPLRDDQPSRTRPVITFALIAFCVLVFLYQVTLDERGIHELLERAAILPAKVRDALRSGDPALIAEAASTLVTSQFLHGGLLHLVLNLWALWIFGDNVEDRLGATRYVLFYVACGAAAGALHVAARPASEIPTVGASGAIAGVMGAYLVLYPKARVIAIFPVLFYPVFVTLPAVVYLGVWFAIQIFSGALEAAHPEQGGGVAWWAHVGGFLTGVGLLPFLVRRRRGAD